MLLRCLMGAASGCRIKEQATTADFALSEEQQPDNTMISYPGLENKRK